LSRSQLNNQQISPTGRESYHARATACEGTHRYTGALKELFLLAAENVGDRLKDRKKVGAEKEQKLYRHFRV
jgi:hypothetical protein